MFEKVVTTREWECACGQVIYDRRAKRGPHRCPCCGGDMKLARKVVSRSYRDPVSVALYMSMGVAVLGMVMSMVCQVLQMM